MLQTSVWLLCQSKIQSKVNFLCPCPSATSTSFLALFALMQLFTQPFCIQDLRKGRMRIPALILLILQFYYPQAYLQGHHCKRIHSLELSEIMCWVGVGVGFGVIISLMYCGCEGKKKARMQRHCESVDSPFQVRLIKFLGLHSLVLDKFVFRRKKSTYSISNIKGSKTLFLDGERYQPPDYYRSQVEIIESEGHSVPVVRLYPIKLEEGERLPCIVYAHGNSSDLGDSMRFLQGMTLRFKAEYVAFDYTGYGASRVQSVGEEVICGDLELVLAWLGRPLQQVILWGFSLGSYPVTVSAAKHQVKATILQCPIGSLSCMFYDEYQRDIKFKEDHFANIDHIAAVTGRVLLMHSLADEIIPVEQARLLYSKYVQRNGDSLIEFIEVEKIKHNAFHKYFVSPAQNELQKQLISFLELNKQEIEEVFSSKIGPSPLSSTLSTLQQSIHTAQLEQQFEEQDFQLAQTETKTRNRDQSPSEWFCYRK